MSARIAFACIAMGVSLACQAAAPNEMTWADAEHLLATNIESCIANVRDNRQRSQAAVTFKQGADDSQNRFNQDQEAVVIVQTLVDALGNARFVHVDRRLATNDTHLFDEIAVSRVQSASWKPAQQDGHAVAVWMHARLDYLIDYGPGSIGTLMTADTINDLLNSAAKGDSKAIATVSFVNSIANQEMSLSRVAEATYLADASLDGDLSAVVRMAVLTDTPVCMQPALVRQFLRQQAASGFAAAQMVLAGELMEAGSPTTHEQIASLLHSAAGSNESFVMLWSTGLLATNPVAALRDPSYALERAKHLTDMTDPDTLEVIAAAEAANAHFDTAVATEKRALAAAKNLDWKDDELRKRLATYQARKPWTGYLCDCTRLVPGEMN